VKSAPRRITMKTTMGTVAAVLLVFLATSCDTSISPSQIVETPSPVQSSGDLAQLSSLALTNDGPDCVGARSPGFYCRVTDKPHPDMEDGEFQGLVTTANTILGPVEGLTDIGAAVCFKGNKLPEDQLLRHLATLALNLAANLISENTPLTDPPEFATVGEALTAAIEVANNPTATRQKRNAIKDVLDQINNNENTVLGEDCLSDNGGEEPE
jgi:hypothetical protein